MVVNSNKNKEAGFALVEAVLLLVVLAAIVGVGAYVVKQKHAAEATLSSSNNSAQAKAPTGSTASIDQTTQQDAKTESGIDNSADTSTQQSATGANGAVANVGGAYNEASY